MNPITEGYNEIGAVKRSPLAEGFMAALKAALIGAPIGAGVQALRGGNMATGAIAGALLPGFIAGFTRATEQKLNNLDTEAMIRYHTSNIRDREPYFFLPPRQKLGRYFTEKAE